MQDTSFALHPDNKQQLTNNSYHDIGNMKDFKKNDQGITIECEQGHVNVEFYRSDIVRIVMNPVERPTMASSFALVKESENTGVEAIENDESILLKSSKIKLVINKQPLRILSYDRNDIPLVLESECGMAYNDQREVICFKKKYDEDHFYGFGEKTGFLNKRGEKYTMWNTDVYAPHNPETNSLYVSIPYFMTLRDGRAHGIFFDNTSQTVFDMRANRDVYSYSAQGGQLDYYILAGPTPKDVLEQYTELTGRMPLPPKWSLGYHQSRYSYETETEVRDLANTFVEKKIPLDAIYLDIHYMKGYRVFTFDKERFPTPNKMVEDLRNKGIRIVPIVDPGVKEDPEYEIYREGILGDMFCKYLEGNLFFGDVWPGKSVFPDLTNTNARKWWGGKHKFYTDKGIEGIWNDMNEPAVFNETKTMDVKVMHGNDGNPKTHRELHNVYGLLMGEATYNGMKLHLNGKRPFLLTRAGYAGVQRYGAVWTGDNRSFWEHLSMALPMCMNLGLSGVPFSGPDVGGFAHDTSGELLTRWTQFGIFTPYFRNHSAQGFARQEPWSFGEDYEMIIKKYIELRYKWLPHFYTLFKEASETGVPVMRPLFMEFPDDSNTYNLSDQFMIGEKVIIAPILKPDTFNRVVYLPDGDWYNYWTDCKYTGGNHILTEANLDTLPIFVKAGAILPEGEVTPSTDYPSEIMTLHVYPKEDETFVYNYYDDDGETFAYKEGHMIKEKVSCHLSKNAFNININKISDGYQSNLKKWVIVLHDQTVQPMVCLNDQQLQGYQVEMDVKANTASIILGTDL